MATNFIINGDSYKELCKMSDNSVTAIVTDPPYGLSFMGKKWDYDVPSADFWKEALRILSPGGTLLCFAGSRTQHRMAVNIEDAGFILKDCIMWLYGSGFPKATDISKQLDKGKRRIVGTYKTGYSKSQLETGYRPKEYECKITEDKAITPEAKLWNGWKSHGLKPAYEPIIVAMKPNEGSYANNALTHGVGGLNIHECRIGTSGARFNGRKVDSKIYGEYGTSKPKEIYDYGRFPANIILDEEAGKILDEQSGITISNRGQMNHVGKGINNTNYSKGWIRGNVAPYGDKGGASRFFYCAKASKSERNLGCEELGEQNIDYGERKGQNNSTKRPDGSIRKPNVSTNHHPTVKPLKLMEYLVKLVKQPEKNLILDPFIGSGTTALACIENDVNWIGIEREEGYIKIANARIKAKKENKKRGTVNE